MNLCKTCRHYRPVASLDAAGVCLRTVTRGGYEVIAELKGPILAYRATTPLDAPSLALAMAESEKPIVCHLDVRETFGCVQWVALP